MNTTTDETKQTVFGMSSAEPIFDGSNRKLLVPLPNPDHGDVRDPPVPWHLLTPIEPLSLQEDIMQAAMQLAEPSHPWLWRSRDPLEMQEAIVQLAEAIRHRDVRTKSKVMMKTKTEKDETKTTKTKEKMKTRTTTEPKSKEKMKTRTTMEPKSMTKMRTKTKMKTKMKTRTTTKPKTEPKTERK